jgi:predicted RNA methylase
LIAPPLTPRWGRYSRSEDETATLQRNDDPRRITPAQKEAAFSPAGEPFHTISISKPKAGAEPTKPAQNIPENITEAVQGTEKAGELSPLAQRVFDEMSKTVGQRGYLADLRKAFPDVPRAELDKALTEIHMHAADARLMRMDNPRDKRAAESRAAAVDFKGEPLHYFWVNEPKGKPLGETIADYDAKIEELIEKINDEAPNVDKRDLGNHSYVRLIKRDHEWEIDFNVQGYAGGHLATSSAKTWDDLLPKALRRVDSLENGGSPAKAKLGIIKKMRAALYDMAGVDPTKPAQEEKPKGVADTQEFKEWFKGSVVTKDGKPQRMYHGSIVWEGEGFHFGVFKHFDRLASHKYARRPLGMDTVGNWFSDNPKAASHYASSEGTVYPVYLKITNPWRPKDFEEFRLAIFKTNGNKIVTHGPAGSTEPLRAWLKGKGYDGIAFGFNEVDKLDQHVFITLEPDQIVNAITGEVMGETIVPAGQKEHSPFDPSKSVPDAVADYLYRGQAFADIRAARKFVKENGGADLDFKQTEEAIEHGIVKAARAIVAEGKTPGETYNRLVALYANQPKLSSRTSTSIEQQAYSTPAPLAYVASQLAHITPETTVLEPTAGNGMLLIGAKPNMVLVNEINPERFAALKEQGFKASRQDATEYLVSSSNFDAVIANPPFGTVRDGFGTVDSPGRTKRFDLGDIQKGYSTAEIDHVIALKALRAMKDDGHAVLILGGINKLVKTEEDRSNAYHGKAKREFFHVLYNRYNVTDHFTVAGEMYEKQGAGWPIDVIVINGRGKSALKLPSVNVPPVLRSWDELKEKLNVSQPARSPSAEDNRPPGNAPDGTEPGGNAALAEGNNPDAGRGGPPAEQPADGPGKLRAGRDRGQPGNAGAAGEPSEPAVPPGTVQDADRPSGVAPAGGDDGVKPQAIRQEQETEGQVSYRPSSKSGVSLGTLVPKNMRRATEEALAKVTKKQTVDQAVAAKLGMSSNEIGAYFAAEQMDALALALHNLEKGSGFIIGDQTGIGKGRVNAAIIRYAIKNNLTPIFVTEKPNLYGDMYRDLKDTGIVEYLGREPKILMTNANESIPLDDDGKMVLKTPDAKEHNEALMKVAADGKLADHDMLFTTYNQMQQVKGASTPRTALLKALAPNAILILDESHNAGGTGENGQPIQVTEGNNTKVSRADFARELVKNAKGVFYSSATYAKRPSVMGLYSKTDMNKAVDKPEDLEPAMKSGGVPMQQVVAAMLAEAGQYIRRERSFAGITYNAKVVPVDHGTYKAFSGAIYAIHKFSESIKNAIKNIDGEIKDGAAAVTPDGSTGGAGANSTNFTAIMHNLVGQFLLSQKADIAVQEALAALKRNEKPVLTVANTMESFLKSTSRITTSRRRSDQPLVQGPASPLPRTHAHHHASRSRSRREGKEALPQR